MSRIFDFSIPALFDLLGDEAGEALMEASTSRSFRDGETVHVQGEDSDRMGWVESGALAFGMYSEEEGFLNLVELGQGHHFGEFIVFSDEPRRLAAQAIDQTVVREVTREKLEEIVERYPELLKAFLQVASRRTSMLLEVYDDARRLPSSKRIAKLLMILQRNRNPSAALPFTQADLSTLLGISKVTVNQTLKKLEQLSIIETGYRYIRITDPGKLRRFSRAG